MATRREMIALLCQATGHDDARFMAGQWDAIDAIANRRQRVLLVQRTGWGKSMVYFLATRALREQGAGTTLIISPLLALMRNQLQAARRLGLTAATINSGNPDEWQEIMAQVRAGRVDILLVSPERLENSQFLEDCLLPIAGNIAFVVIDEAHCISDWGHDFRPSYQRINRLLRQLPPNVAVLATTATANDRVVADVEAQLGAGTILQRGPLLRETIGLQVLPLTDRASRLAWLAEALPQIRGSGIVYASTTRDTESIAAWLQSRRIDAAAYHAGIDSAERVALEDRLLANQLKVLVATNALGMGFDKPDLAFVIHFQAPQSIVHYYQQVGRAGRGIDYAVGILMTGEEDEEINNYFIDSAYPRQRDIEAVHVALDEADDGLSIPGLLEHVNIRQSQLDKVLRILAVANDPTVVKQGSRWYRTPHPYVDARPRMQRLARQRRAEWETVKTYAASESCLMEFLGDTLDDPDAAACGRCAVCLDEPLINIVPDAAAIARAARFIRRSEVALPPRAQWQSGAFDLAGWRGRIAEELSNEEGRALSIWRDAGWAPLVEQGKAADRFPDELVDACVAMLDRWSPAPTPEWVTCIPSLRSPELVPDFARRLAAALGLSFRPAVSKVRETDRQREMMNGWQQAHNLDAAFAVDPDEVEDGPVLLVDDIVDSRWSLTVAGALLREQGSGPVFPLALALASANNAG